MKIAVIDGQGGGVGKVLIEKLRAEFGKNIEIMALGTNSLATAAMLKAGANQGASGENAIVVNTDKADIIAGCIGILAVGSMMGEITPSIATAVGMSKAFKILIPFGKCMIQVVGVTSKPLNQSIDQTITVIKNRLLSENTDCLDVYLADLSGNAECFMQSVVRVLPEGNIIKMENVVGNVREVRARIKELRLEDHLIILEKIEEK